MGRALHPVVVFVAASVVLATGCDGERNDGSVDEPGADALTDSPQDAEGDAAEADVRADADERAEARPGPLTLVSRELVVLSERVCDIDGDGLGDNAVADLGSPGGELVASFLSSGIAAGIERGVRLVIHLPLVEDLGRLHDESVVVTVFSARDEEECHGEEEDFTDDFSGEEPFCARVEHLDGCGEPLFASTDGKLDEGELAVTMERVVLSSLPMLSVSIDGPVAPGGAGAELTLCGYATASSLESADLGVASDEHSPLEVLVGGGATIGMPGVPGLELDVDIDGDGLERFELDSEHHIVRCIDGDGTVIDTPRCWTDERIADGYSMSFASTSVSAVFEGRQPGWDDRECGPVLERAEERRTGTVPFQNEVDRICPSQAATLDRLLGCREERCGLECADPSSACGDCVEADCTVELASCLDAPICCPSPPETSLFDAR